MCSINGSLMGIFLSYQSSNPLKSKNLNLRNRNSSKYQKSLLNRNRKMGSNSSSKVSRNNVSPLADSTGLPCQPFTHTLFPFIFLLPIQVNFPLWALIFICITSLVIANVFMIMTFPPSISSPVLTFQMHFQHFH